MALALERLIVYGIPGLVKDDAIGNGTLLD